MVFRVQVVPSPGAASTLVENPVVTLHLMEHIDNPNLCSNPRCSVPGAKFQCKCDNARYCGTKCQAEHWSEHKTRCSIRLKKKAQKAKDCMNVREAADASFEAGWAHQKGGEFLQAEQCFLEALRMRSILLKGVVPEVQVAQVHHDLGFLYMETGRYEEGLKHFNEDLRIHRKARGERSDAVSSALHSIGNSLHYLERFDEALETYHESLAISIEIAEEHSSSLSGERAEVAHVLDQAAIAAALTSIGQVYSEIGKKKKALGYFQRALKVHRMCASLGVPEHNVAITLDAMGEIQKNQGQLEEAVANHGEALEIYRRLYDEKHPNIASSLECISNVLKMQGKYEDAHKVVQKCLEIRRNALGDDHDEVAETLAKVGEIYTLQGMPEEALEVLKQGLDISIKIHGILNEKVASFYWLMSECQGREEAIDSLKKARRIYRKLGVEESTYENVVEDLMKLGIRS
jgi:tetratricopeptide (TPR) repeat protein